MPSNAAIRWVVCVAGLLASSACAHAPAESTARARIERQTTAEQRFEAGLRLAQRAEYAQAEVSLTAALSAGYPASRVLPVLLEVCSANAREEAAVAYATPYLRLHPGDFQLRYRVAALLARLGRYAEARRELARVLDTAPNYAPAHYLMGLTLRDHFRDSAQAAEHFSAYRLLSEGTTRSRSVDRKSVF